MKAALTLFAIDRRLKQRTRENALPVLHGKHIHFLPLENEGLAGGRGVHNQAANLAITGLGLGITAITTIPKRNDCVAKTGHSLLMLGAASNLLDRAHHGSVTDMMNFPCAPCKAKHLVWNLADFMILSGAILTSLKKNH